MKTIFIIFLIISSTAFASQDEQMNRLQNLDWKREPASYSIANGDATIITTENDYLVVGQSAQEYMAIMQGHEGYKNDAAIIRVGGPEEDSQVIYTLNRDGYLTKDDWEDNVDKATMLKEIQANTKSTNEVRGEGYPKLFVDSWAQEPYLDNHNNTVYWAISGHDDTGDKFINAKALKLGRHGYTEILWVGTPEQFSSSEEVLEPVLANYSYNEGFQYADYIPGTDKVAAAGVGALVYKLATGKAAAKAGFVALAAVFAKKLWFLIFLPLIYLWQKIKSVFSKE